MSNFKLFWNIHKWVGLVVAVIVAMLAVTGFLLLIKKKADWIQPATLRGEAGTMVDFVTIAAASESVLALGHPDFMTAEDIDRIDVRPDKRVYKFQSVRNHAEAQVDAVTGAVLGRVEVRRSDFIENLHDGSFFGDWVHGWIMPATAVAVLALTGSGLWLWIEPKLRRRRRRREHGLRKPV